MEASSSFATGVAEERSQLYVGRWHHLVSDTNWEKGRIICQWRGELHDAGAPATEYSDEAWATRIGNVSSQHVGRLRRTFLRFGEVQTSYERLYWSHFQAAVEWTDAEMWLEGAVQNKWSVSDMRKARAETTGQAVETELEAPSAEFDEDSADDTGTVIAATPSMIADYDRADADEETAAEEYGDEAAEYDAATNTVTLALKNRLSLWKPFRLQVTGITDAAGNLLDGDRDGLPGGVYSAPVNRRILAGRSAAPRARPVGAGATPGAAGHAPVRPSHRAAARNA